MRNCPGCDTTHEELEDDNVDIHPNGWCADCWANEAQYLRGRGGFTESDIEALREDSEEEGK